MNLLHSGAKDIIVKVVSLKPRQWLPDQIVVPKPRLRGWLHLISAPLSLVAALVLIYLAPRDAEKWGTAVYLVCSLVLFSISALYHRFYWAPLWERMWRRLDHCNIFLLIAGTYTPLSIALLSHHDSVVLLSIVWSGALLGIITNIFFAIPPRWLTTTLYVVLGWVAVWYLPELWQTGGPAVVLLLVAGGILYTVGAVIYALKRPDPFPSWFGFHEVFHTFTVLAWACQCVAVYLAVL